MLEVIYENDKINILFEYKPFKIDSILTFIGYLLSIYIQID